jgi:hypothetical protein
MSDTLLAARRMHVYTEAFKSQKENPPLIALDERVGSVITASHDTPNTPR